MAYTIFYPNKDTTIYQNNIYLNTGIDSILELSKVDTDSSRILMSFDNTEIQDFITLNNITGSYKFYLQLFASDVFEIPYSYTIHVHPILQNWEMGTGKKDILPQSVDAANWIFRTSTEYWGNSLIHYSGSYDNLMNYIGFTGSFNSSVNGNINANISGIILSGSTYIDEYDITHVYTQSINVNDKFKGKFNGNINAIMSGSITALINGILDIDYYAINQGGYYDNSLIASQSFEYELIDLNIDVTNIVDSWITGSLTNNGFLIKLSDIEESRSSNSMFQYFSRDTHTIYPPRLLLGWDDFSFSTSSIIDTYTISSSAYNYVSNKYPLTNIIDTYKTNFNDPILPINAIIQTSESWSFSEIQTTSSYINKFKSYQINYPFYGLYNGKLNGRFVGNIEGNITGSIYPYTPIILNDINISISDFTHTFESEFFNGYIDSYYSCSLNTFNYTGSIIANTNQLTCTGIFTGSFDYFSGSYNGSFNGTASTGIGIITSSINSSMSFAGIFNSSITGSIQSNLNGGLIGNIIGNYSGSLFDYYILNNLNGYISGNIDYPINNIFIENISQSIDIGFSNTLTYLTSSGVFTGYIEGNLYNSVLLFEYYLSGSKYYHVTESINLEPLTNNNMILYLKNPIYHINEDSINLIRVIGRERYPNRTYNKLSAIQNIKYLPTSSYYSILDAHNEDIIIPFSEYSKLNCDEYGNYFMLYAKNLQVERLYRIIFKIILNNRIQIFDDNFIFKIIR